MSHFLARLVERTRGTGPRVEPIVAPRFAPTPVVEIASGREATPPVRRTARPPEAIESPDPEVVRQEKSETPGRENESAEKSIERLQETLLVPLETVSQEAPPVVRRTEIEGEPVSIPRNGSLKGTASAPPAVARPRSAIRPAMARTPGIERTAELPNEPRPEAPIVRVTIGRIEVRAVPAPAAPPRKPSRVSGPKLTLDAYLKSRKEGTR